MSILFDSHKDKLPNPVMQFAKNCRISKYNSFYRLEYNKLDLIIGHFTVDDDLDGLCICLYDINNRASGVLELKSGGWIY